MLGPAEGDYGGDSEYMILNLKFYFDGVEVHREVIFWFN